tara:strand:- start:865 stop:1068 length:204 start_codon:yes stop_codon:yes gene_type:complete
MTEKKFACDVHQRQAMSVDLCADPWRVAVWYTEVPEHSIHMTPKTARKMAMAILKAAEKAQKAQEAF